VGILSEIQHEIVQRDADLGAILLKLQLLASRLGSDNLEEWVRHEGEGYPLDVEVPEYRKVDVTYTGTFSGAFGKGINNAPIPGYLIKELANESWLQVDVRESIAAVADSVAKDGELGIDASNLMLILQGKVYPDYACNAINGRLNPISFREIVQTVRSRILELTIQLEKSIPAAADIDFGQKLDPDGAAQVQQISQQVIYGNVTNVAAGAGSKITLSVQQGNQDSFVSELANQGIVESDAKELVEILASEEPDSAEEPFGAKAKDWVARNIEKSTTGVWGVGVSVGTKLLTEAAKKYYGL